MGLKQFKWFLSCVYYFSILNYFEATFLLLFSSLISTDIICMSLLIFLHYVPRCSLHITSSLFLREINCGEDYSPDYLEVQASV